MSIKVITEPSVYLVGRQQVGEAELSRFLADEGVESWTTDTEVAGQKLIEVAGRLCYLSFARPRPGGNAAYIGHLLEVGHGSCLEHAVFNLIITGVSRSFTHELIRHRAGFGFSQLSQRFVDESDTAFVVPPALAEEVAEAQEYVRLKGGNLNMATLHIREDYEDESEKQEVIVVGLEWLKCAEHSRSVYGQLSDYLVGKNIGGHRQTSSEATAVRKAAREAARSVLPNATETKIFVTANARALRHLIEMRADPAADAEMRAVALAFLAVLRADSPNLFGDYTVGGDPPHATTAYRKV